MAGRSKQNGSVMSHDPLAGMDVDPPPGAAADAAGPAAEAASAGGPVDLGDSLTIPEVAETLERFRAALDLGGTLRILAGELEQVDAAGVQLLCAVVKAAREQALEVAWEGVSETLQQAVRQLGLERELAL